MNRNFRLIQVVLIIHKSLLKSGSEFTYSVIIPAFLAACIEITSINSGERQS